MSFPPQGSEADVSALALEATLTAIKGGSWSAQTLVAINAAIDAIPTTAMRGTDGVDTATMRGTDSAALASAWTAALATALGNTRGMGKLQIATMTWDLLRGGGGAGTDVLFTGTSQAVVLESLIARMPTLPDVTDGDPITSMAFATDDAEPGIIIAAADAPVATMTPEAQFSWNGKLYIPVDTEIEGTIAGGDAASECLVIVTVSYRAVVSGGYLA